MSKNEVKVSVCCITYNQEKFIRDALESFLNQKTNFKFEIIVRDDASTDNTANIIKEYEKKYPDIIKPIYEEINGNLKGIKRSFNITFEKAIGKYIAICEGDDFWCDEYKLQKQYDYMEENKNCTLAVHNAYRLNMKNQKLIKYNKTKDFKNILNNNKRTFDAGEMMLIGYCANFATASMFFRREDVIECPQFYFEAPCGDMPLKMITAQKGYVYYDDKIMATYRFNIGTSMVDYWRKSNAGEKVKRINRFIKLIQDFDEFSNYKYHENLEKCVKFNKINIALAEREYDVILKDKENKEIYKYSFNDIFLIKLFIKKKFPVLTEFIRMRRGRRA